MADDLQPLVQALLNPWQRGFPLQPRPFLAIARALPPGSPLTETAVLQGYARLRQAGALSRLGGIFAPAAGGAAVLAALQVPAHRLEAVAALVSAHPGVNHNYEREAEHNLWFVMTGRDAPAVERALCQLEHDTALRALRLPMVRPYRIDLGFDLSGRTARHAMPHGASHGPVAPLDDADQALAALVEDGLPLLPRPYDAWAQALGLPPEAVLARLQAWLALGQLRRFGAIVRHHELGFAANAMVVFNVPDDQVDDCGARLAAQPGVTLAYRRQRAAGWPYNLYAMVHGTDRAAVLQVLAGLLGACGLQGFPQAVLFSRRRFKQTGARRFRDLPDGPVLSASPPARAPQPHREPAHAQP